jgi:CRISPR-associated protein Csa3
MDRDIMENTLISTIYSLEPVMACITRFSPQKLVLLREEDAPEKKLEAERMLNETVGRVLEVKTQHTSIYDVVKIARDTAEVIEGEYALGRNVVVKIGRAHV